MSLGRVVVFAWSSLLETYLPPPEPKAWVKTNILQNSWIYKTHIEIYNTITAVGKYTSSIVSILLSTHFVENTKKIVTCRDTDIP